MSEDCCRVEGIRDDIIRDAHRAGASIRQVAEVSGLGRKTGSWGGIGLLAAALLATTVAASPVRMASVPHGVWEAHVGQPGKEIAFEGSPPDSVSDTGVVGITGDFYNGRSIGGIFLVSPTLGRLNPPLENFWTAWKSVDSEHTYLPHSTFVTAGGTILYGGASRCGTPSARH